MDNNNNNNSNERNLALAAIGLIIFMIGTTPIYLKLISKGDIKEAIVFLGGSLIATIISLALPAIVVLAIIFIVGSFNNQNKR